MTLSECMINANQQLCWWKQLEKASLSLKPLSDITGWVFGHDSLYFLKTWIDSMTILVSSVKINKTTISLKPSPSTTSSKYTGILKSINLYVASANKISGNFSNISFMFKLDKIILWSSFHRRLGPRFETDEGTKTFERIFFNWALSPGYQIISQKTKADCLNLLNNLLNWNLK